MEKLQRSQNITYSINYIRNEIIRQIFRKKAYKFRKKTNELKSVEVIRDNFKTIDFFASIRQFP